MPSFDLNTIQRDTGLHVEYHETLDSTNQLASELMPALLPLSPALVLTATQTAGRGRGQNAWWANTGALTFSLVLDRAQLQIPIDRLPLVSLAAGLAVRRSVSSLVPGADISIKWPNDVFLNQRKVCGILTEQIPVEGRSGLIIGVGLNVNNSLNTAPDEVQQRATSLYDTTGDSLDLTTVLIAIVQAIKTCIEELGTRSVPLFAELNRHSLLNGRTVAIQSGDAIIQGLCHGIDDDGALIVITAEGPKSLIAGTVTEW